MRASSARFLNPFNLLSRRTPAYEPLPSHERQNGSAKSSTQFPAKVAKLWPQFLSHTGHQGPNSRWRAWRIPLRIISGTIILAIVIAIFTGGRRARMNDKVTEEKEEAKIQEEQANKHFWESFPRLDGFYYGVKELVSWDKWEPEDVQQDALDQPKRKRQLNSALPLKPVLHNPYPDYRSSEYLSDYYPVEECFLDVNETKPVPDVYVYPGVPQHMTMPLFGAYSELGLTHDVCFERFGRLSAYGYGYDKDEGGLGVGLKSEKQGVDELWEMQPKINYTGIDWGKAQNLCYKKNKQRFIIPDEESDEEDSRDSHSSASSGLAKLPRQAYVLRTWTGFDYTPHEILALRSFVAELALKSSGEYDVHLLLHVKDDTIPIWSSKEVYRRVIEENVPKEFWGITTLWSVQLMKMYYPGPFGEAFANVAGQEIHGVYRSAHMALQWFAQEHPEYDYVWNWEMDVRYSGHNYEFHQAVAGWARDQPRKGLWERNAKFWIPAYHGSWANYTKFVDDEMKQNETVGIWGPVSFPSQGDLSHPPETTPPRTWQEDNFEWGVGEEADLITFNPLFDPSKTNWVFRQDISGYSLKEPIPPRRCAIVTISRLSRRLLNLMHEETYISKHSAFPEMWPPTVALHHGLKAVYIPHPVYFDRKWDLAYMDQIFNYPETDINSPFGWGEHNWLGSSFYYNAGFSGALWRRWYGQRENNEGGAYDESHGSGRMCLRATLHHPIKNEDLPEE